jgi:hypothetical protein
MSAQPATATRLDRMRRLLALRRGGRGADRDPPVRAAQPLVGHQYAGVVVGVSAFVGFGVFGALIVTRQPGIPIGWLFCAAALGASLGGLATQYAIEALVLDPGSLPAGTAMAWLGSWTWILFVPVPGTIGLLLFPTGRLPSARWRPALWFAIAVNAALLAGFGFAEGEIDGFDVDNPLGFAPQELEAVGTLLLVAVALAFASLISRYRAARGEERQQLKWIAAAAALYQGPRTGGGPDPADALHRLPGHPRPVGPEGISQLLARRIPRGALRRGARHLPRARPGPGRSGDPVQPDDHLLDRPGASPRHRTTRPRSRIAKRTISSTRSRSGRRSPTTGG